MPHLSIVIDWLILAGFTVGFLAKGNFEFILYAVTLTILIIIVQRSHRIYQYTPLALWGFTLWLVMHMCGGFIQLNGERLYDLILIPLVPEPYHIFRYDQLVHALCYFVITLLSGRVVIAHSRSNTSQLYIGLIAILAAMGVGAINEMIEFMAVAFLGAAEGVGDYYNNALDICFNGLGALAALPFFRPATPPQR